MNQVQWSLLVIGIVVSIVGIVVYRITRSPEPIAIVVDSNEAAPTVLAVVPETDTLPTAASATRPVATARPRPAPTSIPDPTATAVPPTPLPPTPTPVAFPVDAVQTRLAQTGGTFGVVVYHLSRNEVVYTQNETEVFPAASLIKIPIALTAYALADQGQLDLNTPLTLTADQIVGGTGSLQRAAVGSTYTIRELCARALYDSDNTAANMVLRHVGGLDRVNTLLTDLGMPQTQAQRFLMDFAAQQAGRDNVTSPADVAAMMRMIAQNEVIGGDDLLTAMAQTNDQQKIPALLPPNTVVANKTGVLPAPNGVEPDTSLIRIGNDDAYILVVLSKDLSDNQAAIAAIAEIARLIFEYEQQRMRESHELPAGQYAWMHKT